MTLNALVVFMVSITMGVEITIILEDNEVYINSMPFGGVLLVAATGFGYIGVLGIITLIGALRIVIGAAAVGVMAYIAYRMKMGPLPALFKIVGLLLLLLPYVFLIWYCFLGSW